MKINYSKAFKAIYNCEKLPRKTKKALLGKRMSKSKLNRLIKSVKVIRGAKTMYENPEVEPYLFCPNCGESKMYGTGNRTSYPEHWEYFHCFRCKDVVAYIDNSPFIHILQYKEDFEYFPV